MSEDRLFRDLQVDMHKFRQIKKALKSVMMTENYLSMTDEQSLKNFIKELYPEIEIDKINGYGIEILGYRILLTK